MEIVRNPNWREHIQEGEQALLDSFKKSTLTGWTVFEQPHLNGDRPDFVLTHPTYGAIIIEVKDWNMNAASRYRSDSRLITASGEVIKIGNPLDQVVHYKDSILKLYSRKYLEVERELKTAAYGLVRTAVYFHNVSKNDIKRYCAVKENHKFVEILDRDSLTQIIDGTCSLFRFSRCYDNQIDKFINDLNSLLHPDTYHLDRVHPIKLNREQRNYVASQPGLHRRLKGVAGAGKTLVLATKAANLLSENKRVLVLSYNITLRHYIRDLINQQYFQGPPRILKENLVIHHFHSFLKALAVKLDVELPSAYSPVTKTTNIEVLEQGWVQILQQAVGESEILPTDFTFDAILIDEGQDFSFLWTNFLLKFLKSHDELMVAYDLKQDIYDRQRDVWIENPNQIRGLGFRGKPAELRQSERIPNKMANLLLNLRKTLKMDEINIELKEGQLDLFTSLEWKNTSSNHYAQTVLEYVNYFRDQGAALNDISIICNKMVTGIGVVQLLEQHGYNVCHVYDMRGQKDVFVRQQQKWKFQPGNGQIKVCTVASFKGWESPNMIYCLDPFLDMSIEENFKIVTRHIYIALTRLKYTANAPMCNFVVLNQTPGLEKLEQIWNTSVG